MKGTGNLVLVVPGSAAAGFAAVGSGAFAAAAALSSAAEPGTAAAGTAGTASSVAVAAAAAWPTGRDPPLRTGTRIKGECEKSVASILQHNHEHIPIWGRKANVLLGVIDPKESNIWSRELR